MRSLINRPLLTDKASSSISENVEISTNNYILHREVIPKAELVRKFQNHGGKMSLKSVVLGKGSKKEENSVVDLSGESSRKLVPVNPKESYYHKKLNVRFDLDGRILSRNSGTNELDNSSNMLGQVQSYSRRICCFCHSGSKIEIPASPSGNISLDAEWFVKCRGRLLPYFDGAFAHVNCIRFSSEVIERNGILCNASSAKLR